MAKKTTKRAGSGGKTAVFGGGKTSEAEAENRVRAHEHRRSAAILKHERARGRSLEIRGDDQ